MQAAIDALCMAADSSLAFALVGAPQVAESIQHDSAKAEQLELPSLSLSESKQCIEVTRRCKQRAQRAEDRIARDMLTSTTSPASRIFEAAAARGLHSV